MITVRSAARPLAVLLLLTALTACQAGAAEPASPSSAPSSPTASPDPSHELTYEEDLAVMPPAPTAVRAVVTDDDNVSLSWQLPPTVTVEHRSSDVIVEYRIHRRGPGETEMTEVGSVASPASSFVDPVPGTGDFAYVVTAVHEGNVESSTSDPAAEVTV